MSTTPASPPVPRLLRALGRHCSWPAGSGLPARLRFRPLVPGQCLPFRFRVNLDKDTELHGSRAGVTSSTDVKRSPEVGSAGSCPALLARWLACSRSPGRRAPGAPLVQA